MNDIPESANQIFFSLLSFPTNFFLLRHGESEGNAKNIIQGHLDFPLNENGRQQACSAGNWLKRKKIQYLFSSPLSRARETAEIISRISGSAALTTDPLFKEINTGIFSGRSLDENFSLHPEIAKQYLHSSWDAVPGAENSAMLYSRAMDAWTTLRSAAGKGGGIVLVTHGGFIQWMVRTVFGVTTWMPLIPTGNCCIYQLQISPNRDDQLPLIQWKLMNHEPGIQTKLIKPVF